MVVHTVAVAVHTVALASVEHTVVAAVYTAFALAAGHRLDIPGPADSHNFEK